MFVVNNGSVVVAPIWTQLGYSTEQNRSQIDPKNKAIQLLPSYHDNKGSNNLS